MLVISLLSLLVKPLGFILLLIFPFLPLVAITRRNVLLSVPILFSLNILAAIINAVLLDSFGLPVTLETIVGLTVLEGVILFLVSKARINFILTANDKKYIYLIYFIFLLAIISRVVSVAHLYAPILHDPQAHAFWANKIIQERAIDYFYSPGLHIWSALTTSALNINVARTVHYITNFFSAFSVLMWALIAYIITKKSRLAAWVALFALITPLPQFLYFMAGKNAFVMTTPFIALALMFSLHFYVNRIWVNALLLLVALLGIGLIHYPAYAYTAGSVIIFILIKYFSENYPTLIKNIKIHTKKLTSLLTPVLISLILIALNILITKSENVQIDTVSSRAEAKAYHQKVSQSNQVPSYESVSTDAPSRQNIDIRNPVTVTENFGKEYISFTKSFSKDTGLILLGAMLVGLYFLVALKPHAPELAVFRIILISLLLSAVLLILTLRIAPVGGLNTTGDTGFLLMPLILSAPIAWLFTHISKRKFIEAVAIVALAVMSSLFTFNIYRQKSASSFVDQYDVQAYQWINQNVDDSEKFIGLSNLDPVRKSIVFPVDGALWLPVFTDNEISNPFHELRFHSIQSHMNLEYSRKLKAKNEEKVKNSVNYFLENNYRYIYVDGESAYHELGIKYLVDNELARIEYKNESVSIVRLNED